MTERQGPSMCDLKEIEDELRAARDHVHLCWMASLAAQPDEAADALARGLHVAADLLEGISGDLRKLTSQAVDA